MYCGHFILQWVHFQQLYNWLSIFNMVQYIVIHKEIWKLLFIKSNAHYIQRNANHGLGQQKLVGSREWGQEPAYVRSWRSCGAERTGASPRLFSDLRHLQRWSKST